MKTKSMYETPEVEIIEVEVEKGFAVSDPRATADDFSDWEEL